MTISIDKIIKAIEDAESYGLVKDTENDILTGYSGEKLMGTLQRLSCLFSEEKDVCYLEVGVYQGLTLLSTANVCHHLPCYGIDNFSLDPEKKNFSIVSERIKKLGLTNVGIINQDYEDALQDLETYIGDQKIGVYFVDGPHDYRSQLMCLQLVMPYLHENAVIIVDDSNYRHVRQANRDFLVTHPKFKLAFEAYAPCHPSNMPPAQQEETRKSWWNGVNILVRDIGQELQPMFPPTERSRNLYENEHIIHASYLSELTPQLLYFIHHIYNEYYLKDQDFALERVSDCLSKFEVLFGNIKLYLEQQKRLGKQLYVSMNTFSEYLPSPNYNRPRNVKS